MEVTHFVAGAYSTTGGQNSCQKSVNSTAKTQHGLHTSLPTTNYPDCIYTLGAPLTWCLSTNQKPNLKHQGDGLGKILSNQPESYNGSFGRLDAYTRCPSETCWNKELPLSSPSHTIWDNSVTRARSFGCPTGVAHWACWHRSSKSPPQPKRWNLAHNLIWNGLGGQTIFCGRVFSSHAVEWKKPNHLGCIKKKPVNSKINYSTS